MDALWIPLHSNTAVLLYRLNREEWNDQNANSGNKHCKPEHVFMEVCAWSENEGSNEGRGGQNAQRKSWFEHQCVESALETITKQNKTKKQYWKTEKYKHANMGTFFTKPAQTTCQTRNFKVGMRCVIIWQHLVSKVWPVQTVKKMLVVWD